MELQGKAEELVYYSAKAKEYRTKNKELEVEYSNLKSQKLALEQDIHLKYTNETINSSVMKDFLLEKAYL